MQVPNALIWGLGLTNLQDFCQKYQSLKNLCYKSKSQYVPKHSQNVKELRFAVAAAELRNSLPDNVKHMETIIKHQKHYLKIMYICLCKSL